MNKNSVALPGDVADTVRRALREDIGSGDITACLIPHGRVVNASVVCRQNAILCGSAWFESVFHELDGDSEIVWQFRDGDELAAQQTVCRVRGDAAALVSGERTALNFLQTLSGTATLAHHYAGLIADLKTRILDTRKTIPGLRSAQKYAVAVGGCMNHRQGLFDGILIKENHIIAAGSISAAVGRMRELQPAMDIEVEVETLDELREALAVDADRILLDNFSLEQLRQAVSVNAGRALLEASGGVTTGRLREIAETGVDFISVGALTKDVQAIDLSMRFNSTDLKIGRETVER